MSLTLLVGCGKTTNEPTNKNGNSKEDVVVEEVSFSNIKLTYNGGITILETTIKNNKKFIVNVNLKYNFIKEFKNLYQVIKGLELERNQKTSNRNCCRL